MTNDWEPDWIENRPGFLQMPDTAKDEFHERIFQFLSRRYEWGHSARTVSFAGVRVQELIANTATGPHTSRLWMADLEGGLFSWTVGTGEADPSECELWEAAAADALARLGQRHPVSWKAYLAQEPAFPPYMRFRLGERVVLPDDLALVPVTGVMTVDVMENVGGVMAGVHASGLIRVDGSTLCYAWHFDGQTAARRRLRLLVAELSFAWDSPWFLRDGPWEHVDMTWAAAPGPVSGAHYGWSESTENPLMPPAATLPAWITDIDATLTVEAQRDSPLHRAFLMHHEGLLVAREHPSLALLSFVASIETLGGAAEKLPRCETCNLVTGSTARLKNTVHGVLPEKEAELLGRAYARRSRTVHDARLHGREVIAGGWGEMSLYLPDEALRFEVGVVRTAQKASRALLWRELGIQGVPTDPWHPTG